MIRPSLKTFVSSTIHDSDQYEDENDHSKSEISRIRGSPFLRHLHILNSQVTRGDLSPEYMDDELKRMEIQIYNLSDEDAPKCIHPPHSDFVYSGPTTEPDSRCYELVTKAYAMAQPSKKISLLAEDVIKRYESYNSGQYPNRYIMRGMIRAMVEASDFKRAREWLIRMEDRFQETKDIKIAPDTRTYGIYTRGLSMDGLLDKEANAREASGILQHMRDRYISGENPLVMPNRFIYTQVMVCESRFGKGMECFDRVESLYRQLENDYQDMGQEALKPDSTSVLPLFEVALNSSNREVTRRALAIFEEMDVRYCDTGDSVYKPTPSAYKTLFLCLGNLPSIEARKFSMDLDNLLKSMKRNNVKPKARTITAAMQALVNQKSEERVRQAEELARGMLTYTDIMAYESLIKGYARVDKVEKAFELVNELEKASLLDRVQVLVLGSLIDSLSKTRSVDLEYAIHKAEWLLDRIIAKYENDQVHRNERDVDSWVFECVIRLWSKRHTLEAAERIDALRRQMEELNAKYPKLFRPMKNINLLAMDAWALSGNEHAGKHAMAILRKTPAPSSRFLASALSSVSRSSGRGVVKTAENLYEQIIELYKKGDRTRSVNARTLTTLLSVILRAPEREMTGRALHILRQTLDLGRENLGELAPNTIVFNCVLNGLAKRKASEEAWAIFEEMKTLINEGYNSEPDLVSYACLARAISMDKDASRAMTRLDSIVLEVQDRISKGSLKGDIGLFNSLVKSYACLSNYDDTAGKKANQLLTQLESSSFDGSELSPDILTYRNVCEACAMSRAPDSAEMAEETFRKACKMNFVEDDKASESDLVSYVVLAHTRSRKENALERAENFVTELEGLTPMLLNTRSYNTLLAAYANSKDASKVVTGQRLFKTLNDKYQNGQSNCEPDTNSFNWLILAAANSNWNHTTNKEYFGVALENFKTLHMDSFDAKPDSLTYEFFLRACNRLLPEGETRSKLVEKAFDLCSKNGLVTVSICKEAAKSNLQLMLRKLETTEDSKAEGSAFIPAALSHNIRRRKKSNKVFLKVGPT